MFGLGVAGAQSPVPANLQKGFSAIQEEDLRKDLSYVASDALNGRMSLQPGDEAAVKWIAEQFAKAGLTPAATDDHGQPSFMQTVPLIDMDRPCADFSIADACRENDRVEGARGCGRLPGAK